MSYNLKKWFEFGSISAADLSDDDKLMVFDVANNTTKNTDISQLKELLSTTLILTEPDSGVKYRVGVKYDVEMAQPVLTLTELA